MRAVRSHDDGLAVLYDARLLASNVLDRVSQNALVVQADGRDHAQLRVDDVGGVQTTAQADFDHRHVHVLLAEVVERHSSDALKEAQRRGKRLLNLVDLLQVANHVLLGNHLPVDGDALTETGNVGRNVHARLVARGLQRLRDLEDHGTLPVRTRHVDRANLARRIPQLLVEENHVLQTHLHLQIQILRVKSFQQIYASGHSRKRTNIGTVHFQIPRAALLVVYTLTRSANCAKAKARNPSTKRPSQHTIQGTAVILRLSGRYGARVD